MEIIVVGVNYRTTSVKIREQLSFLEQDLPRAMQSLQQNQHIIENIILSTCNRTEIYAVIDEQKSGLHAIEDFLAQWFDLPKKVFENHLFTYQNDEMIEHLMQVSAGMDSMVLGETQILGQVRDSFLLAQTIQTTGPIFNRLFKQAITFSKKAHRTTDIASNAVSISYAAVELAKQIFGDLSDKHVSIIGAGEMGELALKNLQGNGTKSITVLNRTFETAEQLASQFGGFAKSIKELQCNLLEADIIISSTSALLPIIQKDMVRDVMRLRKNRPLFLIDIAVPRDIESTVGQLKNVFLYDIDDLQGIVDANLAERERAAVKIRQMIEAEVIIFNEWLASLGVIPVITAIKEKGLSIQQSTLDSIFNKIPDLTEREQKVLTKHTASIVNQLLMEPIEQLKEMATDPKRQEKLQVISELFGVEDAVDIKNEQIELAQKANKRLCTMQLKGVTKEPKLSF